MLLTHTFKTQKTSKNYLIENQRTDTLLTHSYKIIE